MATVTYTIYGEDNLDDVLSNANNTQGLNNNSSQYNTTWFDIGNHGTAGYRPVPGFIFTLPAAINDYTADDVLDCYLEISSTATAGTVTSFPSGSILCKLINNVPTGGTGRWPSTFSSTNGPVSMYNDATGVTAIDWTAGNGAFTGTWNANEYKRGPSLTSHLQAAMNGGAGSGDRLTVVCFGQNAGVKTQRCNSYNTGSNRPRLVIEFDQPAENNGVTITPPSVSCVTQGYSPLQVGYHDGIGSDAKRVLDGIDGGLNLFLPPTAGPWPLCIYVHSGGFSTGTKRELHVGHLSACLRRGWAVASLDYKLATSAQYPTNNNVSHPHSTQDVICAIKWLIDTFSFEEEHIVIAGYSAGGTIGLEAALTLQDSNTYEWTYTTSNNNARNGDGVDIEPEWRYTQGRTGLPSIAGVFIWSSPMDMSATYTYINGGSYGAGTLVDESVRNYYGYVYASPYQGISWDGCRGEDSLYDLITGDDTLKYSSNTAQSIYGGQMHVPTFPIGYVEARENSGAQDVVVPPVSGGIDILKTALLDVGYPSPDTSTIPNEVNEQGGLSHWRWTNTGSNPPLEFAHEKVYLRENWTSGPFVTWLDALGVYRITVPSAPEAVFGFGNIQAEAVYLNTVDPDALAHSNTFGNAIVIKIIEPTGFANTNSIPEPGVTAVGGDQTFSIDGLLNTSIIPTPFVVDAGAAPYIGEDYVGEGDFALRAPSAIASSNTFGVPSIGITVLPSGLVNANIAGTVILHQDIAITAYVSTTEFGVFDIHQTILVDGVINTNTLGTVSVGQDVAATAIESTVVIPDVDIHQSVSVAGTSNSNTFGVDVVNQTVSANGLVNTNIFGTLTINQTVPITGYTNTNMVPSIFIGQQVVCTGIASTNTFGTGIFHITLPVLGLLNSTTIPTPGINGTITSEVDAVVSSVQFGDLDIHQSIEAIGITSTNALGSVLLVQERSVDGLVNATTFGVPSIHQVLSASALDSTNSLGSVDIHQLISATAITSSENIPTPDVDGTIVRSVDGVVHSNVAGVPTIHQTVIVSALLQTNIFGVASIVQMSEPLGIVNTNMLPVPDIHQLIAVTGISSGVTIGVHDVSVTGGAPVIEPTAIEDTNTFGTVVLNQTLNIVGLVNQNIVGVHSTHQQVSVIAPSSNNTFGIVVTGLGVSVVGVSSVNSIGTVVIRQLIPVGGVIGSSVFGLPYIPDDQTENFFLFFMAGY